MRRYTEERRDSAEPRRKVEQDEELRYQRVRQLRALKGGDPPGCRSREEEKVQLFSEEQEEEEELYIMIE